MEGVDIPMMVLRVFAGAGGKGRIEQTAPIPAGGGKKQHGQARLPQGAEFYFQQHIRREHPLAPKHIIGLLAQAFAFRVFQAQPALGKADQRLALQQKFR